MCIIPSQLLLICATKELGMGSEMSKVIQKDSEMLKGIVRPNISILSSSSTHTHVIQNLYDLLSSAKYKTRNLKKILFSKYLFSQKKKSYIGLEQHESE